MADAVQKIFRFKFDFNKKDIKKQLKEISGDVAALISDIGSASDKVVIFKDMIGYLDKIDSAIAAFKSRNKNAFEEIFSGFDGDALKYVEKLFGVDGGKIALFHELQKQVEAASKSGAKLDKLKQTAIDINALLDSVGIDKKINLDIFEANQGKKTERLDALRNALDSFVASFTNAREVMKNGFGGTGGTGGGAGGGGFGNALNEINKKIQEEIDELDRKSTELEQQKHRIQETIIALKGEPIDIGINKKNDAEMLKGLIDEYKQVTAKLHSPDFKMIPKQEQQAIIAEQVRIASKLQKASTFIEDGGSNNATELWTFNINTIREAKSALSAFKQKSQSDVQAIIKLFNSMADGISQSLAQMSMDKYLKQFQQQTGVGDTITSYEQLISVLQEYRRLITTTDTTDADGVSINKKQQAIYDLLMSASKLSQNQDDIEDLIYSLDDDSSDENLKQVADSLREILDLKQQIASTGPTTGGGTSGSGSGSGGADKSELDASRAENDRLREENQELQEKLEYAKKRGFNGGQGGSGDGTGDSGTAPTNEDQIESENDALKKQIEFVKKLMELRELYLPGASKTKLNATDENVLSPDEVPQRIKEAQSALHSYIAELVKLEEQEKKNGVLTEAELERKSELIDNIQDLRLAVRYKDGSYYNTDDFGGPDANLSEQIVQLKQIVNLRKKIAYAYRDTGSYGSIEDTFSGANVSYFISSAIGDFGDVYAFDESIVGRLVREYQSLYQEMAKCLLVGEKVPQSTLDKLKWFENIDAEQLQNIIPRLSELQEKIATIQENVNSNVVTSQDETYYDDQIQSLRTLIELQKEYVSLCGPAETDSLYTALLYSTDELQEMLDINTKLKQGAQNVAKLRAEFPGVNLNSTADLTIVLSDLQKGYIQYEKALSQVRELLAKQKETEGLSQGGSGSTGAGAKNSIAAMYDSASEPVQKLIDKYIILNHQVETFNDRTKGVELEGFSNLHPSDFYKNYMIVAFEELKRVKAEIANMPVVETEDDKQKLMELKEEAERLHRTLDQVYVPDSTMSSYAEYGLRGDELKQFWEIFKGFDGTNFGQDLFLELRQEWTGVFNEIHGLNNDIANVISQDTAGWAQFAKAKLQEVYADTPNYQNLLNEKLSAAATERIARQTQRDELLRQFKGEFKNNGINLIMSDAEEDAYDAVLQSIKDGTVTTIDQCIAKFEELSKSSVSTLSELGKQIVVIKDIAQAYRDLKYAMEDGADTTKELEKVAAFENQYQSLIATLKDGTKVDIALGDQFTALAQPILRKADQIQNVELIARGRPKSSDDSAQATASAQQEIENLQLLKDKIAEVTQAVKDKTDAFNAEATEVDTVVGKEKTALAELEQKLKTIKELIGTISHTESNRLFDNEQLDGVISQLSDIYEKFKALGTEFAGISDTIQGIQNMFGASDAQNADFNDDEIEYARKERGSLDDKLEILYDVARDHGVDISQAKRNKYEELNQKDMNDELTSKQAETFSDLGETINEADDALEAFGATYEKIILKFADGKKNVEIMPDDAGLKKLFEYSEGYGDGEYKGREISDVEFVRTPEATINTDPKKQMSIQIDTGKLDQFASDLAQKLDAIATSFGGKLEQASSDFATKFNAGAQNLTENLNQSISGFNTKLEPSINSVITSQDNLTTALNNLAESMKQTDTTATDADAERAQQVELMKKNLLEYDNMSLALSELNSTLSNLSSTLEHLIGNLSADTDVLTGYNAAISSLSNKDIDLSSEITQCQTLLQTLREIETAIDNKTAAFEDERAQVLNDIPLEVNELLTLKQYVDALATSLGQIFNDQQINPNKFQQWKDDLATIKTNIDTVLTELREIQQISIDLTNAQNGTGPNATPKYAMDATIQESNNLLKEISGKLSKADTFSALIDPIKVATAEMQNVAKGIIAEQQRKKIDTRDADLRLNDPKTYEDIKQAALSAVSGRMMSGGQHGVTGAVALADGAVKVTGYIQTATDAWEGFTVQVDAANQASKVAYDVNAQAARKAAEAAKAQQEEQRAKENYKGPVDDDGNPRNYTKAETEALALQHLKEYTDQGKNATLQFKDSGRYTITVLEEIDGLSRQIFQTFDETNQAIERTTTTVSNKQKIQLQNLKSVIDAGMSDGLVGPKDSSYSKYQEASNALDAMNDTYRERTDLSNEELAQWNDQIKLVQRLGADVEKLIGKRKVWLQDSAFLTGRNKKLNQFDLDQVKMKADIDVSSYQDQIDTARTDIAGAMDQESLQIAINKWEALKSEIKKAAIEKDLFIKKDTTGIAIGAKRLQEYQTNATKMFAGTGIGLTGTKTQEQSNVVRAYDIIVQKIDDLKSSNSALTDQQLAELDQLTVALQLVTDQYNQQVAAAEEAAAKQEAQAKLKTSIADQLNVMDEYKSGLKNVGLLTDDLSERFDALRANIAQATDPDALTSLIAEFAQLKDEIGIQQTSRDTANRKFMIENSLQGYINSMTGKSKKVGFDINSESLTGDQLALAQKYTDILNKLRLAKKNAGTLSQTDLSDLLKQARGVITELDQSIVASENAKQAQKDADAQLKKAKQEQDKQAKKEQSDQNRVDTYNKKANIDDVMNDVKNAFKSLDFSEYDQQLNETQQGLANDYKDIVRILGEYKVRAQNGESVDLEGVKHQIEDLKNSINEYTGTVEASEEQAKKDKSAEKVAKEIVKAERFASADKIKRTANTDVSSLGFKLYSSDLSDEQKEIVTKYDQLIAKVAEYKILVKNGQEVELTGIQEVQQELNRLIAAYKEANNIVNGNRKAHGASSVITATTKYNALKNLATNDDYKDSALVQKKLAEYTTAYNALLSIQSKFKSGEIITDEQTQEFNDARMACAKYAQELNKVLAASEKAKSGASYSRLLSGDFVDNAAGRQTALTTFIQDVHGANATVEYFTDNFNKLIFTVDNGDGTFTRMSAAINAARSGIDETVQSTEAATSVIGRFWNEIKGKLTSIGSYFVASMGWQEVWQELRRGIQYVREIDSALTELKKVTDETDEAYSQFLQDMAKTGSVIGSTVKDLTSSAADWARLGYGMEEAGELAATTSKLFNVSEFSSIDDATSALVSSIQAFTEEGQDVGQKAEEIVDILNNIGNKYPVATNELADGIASSGAALVAANNSIEEQVALLSAGNATMQDISTVAAGLKIVAARLRGTTSDVDDDAESAITNVSKLQSKIQALTAEANGGQGINIINEDGSYKSTYKILTEISKIFDKMDDMSAASLLELIAGKNRSSVVAAILQNGDILEDAYADALDSVGSSANELNTHLDSIQGRIDLFNNSVQTMWMNTLNSSVVKGFVDFGTILIKTLNTIGLLPAAITAITVALSKNNQILSVSHGQFQVFGKSIEKIKTDYNLLAQQASGGVWTTIGNLLKAALGKSVSGSSIDLSSMLTQTDFDEKLNGYITGFNALKGTINEVPWTKYVDGVTASDAAMRAALRTCTEQNGAITAGAGAYTAYTGAATAAAAGNTAVGTTAGVTTGKLLAMRAAALAANAVLTMGVSLAVTGLVSLVSSWLNSAEAAKEAASAAADAAEQINKQSKSLDDYKDTIRELRVELDKNNLSEQDAYDAREKLLGIQNDLIKTYGLEKDGINLVTGAIDEEIAKIDELEKKASKQWVLDNQKDINKAIEFFESDTKGGWLDSVWELGGTAITNWNPTKNIKAMVEEYVKTREHMNTSGVMGAQDIGFIGSVEEVKSEVEAFQKWLAQKHTEIATEISNLSSLPDQDFKTKQKIKSLQKDLEQIKDMQEDIGVEKTNWFGENSTYDSHKKLYEQAQLHTAKAYYTDQYNAILQAKTDLDAAMFGGHSKDAQTALTSLNTQLDAAIALAKTNGQTYMVEFFQGIKDGYAVQIKQMNLEQDLANGVLFGDTSKSIQDVVEGMFEGFDGLNVQGILQLQDIELVGDYEKYASSWNTLTQLANKYGLELEDLLIKLSSLGYVQSGFTGKANEISSAVPAYSTIASAVENLKEAQNIANEAMQDGTIISEDYYNALQEQLSDVTVAEQEFSDAIEKQNGKYIVKNAALLKKLVNQSKKAKQATIQVARAQAQLEYDELVSEIKNNIVMMSAEYRAYGLITDATMNNISSMREQLDALKQTIKQYALLELSLTGAAKAYDEYEKAKERDEQIAYDDTFVEMLTTIDQGLLKNETGTEAFEYAVRAVVPEEFWKDIDDVDKKIKSIHDYIDGDPVFSKLFRVDKESGELDINADNVREFVNMGRERGVFSGDPTDFALSENIGGIEDVAKAYGITEAAALAMLAALEKVDAKWGNVLTDIMTHPLDRAINSSVDGVDDATQALEDFWKEAIATGKFNNDEYQKLCQQLDEANAKLQAAQTNAQNHAKEYNTLQAALSSFRGELKLSAGEASGLISQLQTIAGLDNLGEIKIEDGQLKLTDDQLALILQKLGKLGKEPSVIQVQLRYDDISKQIEEINKYIKDGCTGEITIDGVKITNEAEANALLNKLNPEKAEIEYTYKITETSSDQEKSVLESYKELAKNGLEFTVTADVTDAEKKLMDIDNDNPDDKSFTITADGSMAQQVIKNIADQLSALTDKKITITVEQKKSLWDAVTGWFSGGNKEGGTSALGNAMAIGNAGLESNENDVIVGELGPELVCDPIKGKYYTVGDNGTEMVNLPKGAIVYNHKQTKELLKNGHTTRGHYTGGLSFAKGNAYADYGIPSYHPNYEDKTSFANGPDVNTKWDDALSTFSDAVGDAANEFAESIDWIEIRIEELDEWLGKLNAQLENTVGYTEQNNKINEIIAKNYEKYAVAESAAAYYEKYAQQYYNEIQPKYRDAAQNGAISITDFKGKANEKVVEAIQNYRDYVQKAADLRQTMEELITENADLAKQKFDNVATQYENEIGLIETNNEQLEAKISLMEDSGKIASPKYYEQMMENTKQMQTDLAAEKKLLKDVLDAEVQAGRIEVGSDRWYDMVNALYDVDAQIQDCVIDLESFQNAINEIYWDNFDELISRVDYLKDDAQGLIDLLDKDDMVAKPNKKKHNGGTVEFWTEDDVKWTEEGIATIGLLAQQMEMAEFKSRQYAEAIDDLEVEYAAGKYSESEYLEKLNELTQAQYDSIESYYDAQDAIVELNEARIDSIKEGIEAEIEAYEELIDKKKEALSTEKDLYDFQRGVAEQQKSIAQIERQLASLATDSSMSAAAKRKQLEAELATARQELEDTYYDRSVENRQNALDKELEDFQTEKDIEMKKWEEYLTNVEAIVAESLTIVQANAAGIYDVLNSKAQEYDLTLSPALTTPWEDGSLAVWNYQEQFDTSMSSTMDQLEALKAKWQEVIDKMVEYANTDITKQQVSNDAVITTPKVPETPAPAPDPSPSNPNENTSSAVPVTVGGTATVKKTATHFSSLSKNLKMASFVPGGKYTVYETSGSGNNMQVLLGRNGVYTGWVKLTDLEGYAKGTKGVKKDQWAILDELGEELQLVPDGNGRLAYMKKGTAVLNSTLTERLMDLAMNPQEMLDRNRPTIAPSKSIVNNTIELSIDNSVGTLISIENFDGNNPDEIVKIVNKALDKHDREFNTALRKYVR